MIFCWESIVILNYLEVYRTIFSRVTWRLSPL